MTEKELSLKKEMLRNEIVRLALNGFVTYSHKRIDELIELEKQHIEQELIGDINTMILPRPLFFEESKGWNKAINTAIEIIEKRFNTQKESEGKKKEWIKMPEKETKKEPIYEKLAPGEALIICKDENGNLEVAENINGRIEIRKVNEVEKITEEKKSYEHEGYENLPDIFGFKTPQKFLDFGRELEENCNKLFDANDALYTTIGKIHAVAMTIEERLTAMKFIYSVITNELWQPKEFITLETRNKILKGITEAIDRGIEKIKELDEICETKGA